MIGYPSLAWHCFPGGEQSGLSQERVKTIPNGSIIIQKINLWAIIPFIFNKRQEALK
ncbi:Uncharacterised protein [Salmonella enterica]|nr:hypothetical protein [Salmonella enterica subsp. enterica serovar Newport]EGZ4305555.1 hypothetical protein [Salmonella enterica subsp. enterica serovar Hartford]SUF75432.1 Uncharacterised protein [Salmonella enterica]